MSWTVMREESTLRGVAGRTWEFYRAFRKMVHAGGRHHWSLINDNFDITAETTQDLGSPFAWAPPLSTEPRDADDLLAGLDSILLDDIAGVHEDEKYENFDGVEVLEESVFDFGELDRVERGIIPQAILDGVEECYAHHDSLVLLLILVPWECFGVSASEHHSLMSPMEREEDRDVDVKTKRIPE
ncbi:hypothetical protein EV424DRAFT_1347977 [Suillus variegatus]|nr:hypothetical protein EV424DRAFT_1347977 [Suillus variegatus]